MKIKEKTLTPNDIIILLERCGVQECCDGSYDDCPLKGECLFWWTGDDSELKGDKYTSN